MSPLKVKKIKLFINATAIKDKFIQNTKIVDTFKAQIQDSSSSLPDCRQAGGFNCDVDP